jgi:outer membrane protein TolC
VLYKNNPFFSKQLNVPLSIKNYMLFNKISIYSSLKISNKLFKYGCWLFFFFQLSVPTFSQNGTLITELSYPYLEKLIFTAKANYPRVKSNIRRVNIAKMNLEKEKLSWFEFFTFSAFYSPSTSVSLTNTSYTGVQVGLFINFSAIFQKPILIKQSKEEVAIAQLAADEYMLTIETDVKARYFRYMQALTSLRVRNQILNDIEALYKQVKYKFERGEATFENYNTAIVQLARQKQDIIESESNVLISKSSLEELVGIKLEEVK